MGTHAYKRLNQNLSALLDLMLENEKQLNEGGIYITKKCPDCGVLKVREEYYQSPNSKSGVMDVSTYCKPCERARKVIRRQSTKENEKPVTQMFEQQSPEPIKQEAQLTFDDLIARVRKMIGE